VSFGRTVPAAKVNSTVPVDHFIHHVTGDGSIQTIDAPGFGGGLCVLVADGRWTTNPTGGNVANYIAPTPGQAVFAVYDPITSKWYFQLAHQKAQGGLIPLNGNVNQTIKVDHPVHETDGTGSVQTIDAPTDLSEFTLIPRVSGATTVAWSSGNVGNIRRSITMTQWQLVRFVKNAGDGLWCSQ
jgi:hypothetical protein